MSVDQTMSTPCFAHKAKKSEMEDLQEQLEEQRKINRSGLVKEKQEK